MSRRRVRPAVQPFRKIAVQRRAGVRRALDGPLHFAGFTSELDEDRVRCRSKHGRLVQPGNFSSWLNWPPLQVTGKIIDGIRAFSWAESRLVRLVGRCRAVYRADGGGASDDLVVMALAMK
jgi:hypothetical protein